MDWTAAASRHDGLTHASRVWLGVRHILQRRRATPALHAAHPIRVVPWDIPQILAFRRDAPTGTLLCLFNFAESWAHVPEDWARAQGATRMQDELSNHPVETHHGNIALPPYARVWLA
jgi:amylosucrase